METYSESRPWGKFEKFHENKPCTVKLIHVNPNSRLSLQFHNNRSEFWQVVRGTAVVDLEGENYVLNEGESLEIPKRAKHRLGALDDGCTVMEIAYGRFDEMDIIRLEDDYSRVPTISAPAKVSAAG
jgi:mannose-6-phosphate isomerase-like protein (cupin superfamily)